MDALLKAILAPFLAAAITGFATVKAVEAKLELHVSYLSKGIDQLGRRVETLEQRKGARP